MHDPCQVSAITHTHQVGGSSSRQNCRSIVAIAALLAVMAAIFIAAWIRPVRQNGNTVGQWLVFMDARASRVSEDEAATEITKMGAGALPDLRRILRARPNRLSEWTRDRAVRDAASGIYIDRQFDWPTGEALWVDVPVWLVQLGLVAMTSMAVWLHWRVAVRQRPT